MKTRVDAQLQREASEFQLLFRCDRCAHFVSENGACVNEYPNDAHRDVSLEHDGELVFCKEFELA